MRASTAERALFSVRSLSCVFSLAWRAEQCGRQDTFTVNCCLPLQQQVQKCALGSCVCSVYIRAPAFFLVSEVKLRASRSLSLTLSLYIPTHTHTHTPPLSECARVIMAKIPSILSAHRTFAHYHTSAPVIRTRMTLGD